MDGVEDDDAAGGGAFLAGVAEGGLPHTEHRFIQVGGCIDDDRVLAAHLADDLLDERLLIGWCCGGAEDVEADGLGAGEGDERDARIADDWLRRRFRRPGKEVQHIFGTPASRESRRAGAAMPGVCSAGLTMTVLPVTRAATVMPVQMASGKFQGLITTATPRG